MFHHVQSMPWRISNLRTSKTKQRLRSHHLSGFASRFLMYLSVLKQAAGGPVGCFHAAKGFPWRPPFIIHMLSWPPACGSKPSSILRMVATLRHVIVLKASLWSTKLEFWPIPISFPSGAPQALGDWASRDGFVGSKSPVRRTTTAQPNLTLTPCHRCTKKTLQNEALCSQLLRWHASFAPSSAKTKPKSVFKHYQEILHWYLLKATLTSCMFATCNVTFSWKVSVKCCGETFQLLASVDCHSCGSKIFYWASEKTSMLVRCCVAAFLCGSSGGSQTKTRCEIGIDS